MALQTSNIVKDLVKKNGFKHQTWWTKWNFYNRQTWRRRRNLSRTILNQWIIDWGMFGHRVYRYTSKVATLWRSMVAIHWNWVCPIRAQKTGIECSSGDFDGFYVPAFWDLSQETVGIEWQTNQMVAGLFVCFAWTHLGWVPQLICSSN